MNLHDLGVTGRPGADVVIGGIVGLAAGVAGLDVLDALDLLEDRLGAPEAATPEGGDFDARVVSFIYHFEILSHVSETFSS